MTSEKDQVNDVGYNSGNEGVAMALLVLVLVLSKGFKAAYESHHRIQGDLRETNKSPFS